MTDVCCLAIEKHLDNRHSSKDEDMHATRVEENRLGVCGGGFGKRVRMDGEKIGGWGVVVVGGVRGLGCEL